MSSNAAIQEMLAEGRWLHHRERDRTVQVNGTSTVSVRIVIRVIPDIPTESLDALKQWLNTYASGGNAVASSTVTSFVTLNTTLPNPALVPLPPVASAHTGSPPLTVRTWPAEPMPRFVQPVASRRMMSPAVPTPMFCSRVSTAFVPCESVMP